MFGCHIRSSYGKQWQHTDLRNDPCGDDVIQGMTSTVAAGFTPASQKVQGHMMFLGLKHYTSKTYWVGTKNDKGLPCKVLYNSATESVA